MRINSLTLLNFRNYEHLHVEFHEKLNLIYGKNGSGKTNLIEAIYVLFLTRSFRLTNEKNLITFSKDFSRVEGNIEKKGTYNYRVYLTKEGKTVKINGEKIKRISDYISNIALVLFHPDDLKFIKDAPSTRRKTLNISISLIDISYLRALNQYQILLKQRNAYLRQMAVDATQPSEYLLILTTKLIDYGYEIYQKRKNFIESMQKYLPEIYKKITNLDKLQLLYQSPYENNTKESLLELYKKNFIKDLKLGKTNTGIHMDDLSFVLDDKDLKDYGSEGQQKNAIIAYKFSELEIFKEKTGNYPLLILDDLFSELDVEKIEHILTFLKPEVQTFITTTELNTFNFIENFSYKAFEISDGKVVKESKHGKWKSGTL